LTFNRHSCKRGVLPLDYKTLKRTLRFFLNLLKLRNGNF